MSRRAFAAAALAALLAAGVAPAQAGRPCAARPLTLPAIQQGLDLALRSAQALDASGAQVLVIARAGQDLSAHGLRWSHLGLAYRDPNAQPAGAWRIVHKLNDCHSAEAAVYRQGLGDFFLDQPQRYEAVIQPLAPALAERLLPLLQDNARLAQLHERRYSMVAYPWATTYQQSNQWAIETLALAGEPSLGPQAHRAQAQAWLRLRGYEPTVLKLGPMTRLGARVGTANVAFDDHPNDQRFADRIATVTVDSVLAWLQRSGLGGAPVTVR